MTASKLKKNKRLSKKRVSKTKTKTKTKTKKKSQSKVKSTFLKRFLMFGGVNLSKTPKLK